MLDVFFRWPEAIANLYAVGESKATLSIWAAKFPTSDHGAWQAASNSAAVWDSWPIQTLQVYQETMVTGGRYRVVGEDETVRGFEAEHDQLNWLIRLFGLGPMGPRLPW